MARARRIMQRKVLLKKSLKSHQENIRITFCYKGETWRIIKITVNQSDIKQNPYILAKNSLKSTKNCFLKAIIQGLSQQVSGITGLSETYEALRDVNDMPIVGVKEYQL